MGYDMVANQVALKLFSDKLNIWDEDEPVPYTHPDDEDFQA